MGSIILPDHVAKRRAATLSNGNKGLPPAGAPVQFYGFDATSRTYVLQWDPEQGCWVAVGFVPPGGPKGLEVMVISCRGENSDFIKGHMLAPLSA